MPEHAGSNIRRLTKQLGQHARTIARRGLNLNRRFWCRTGVLPFIEAINQSRNQANLHLHERLFFAAIDAWIAIRHPVPFNAVGRRLKKHRRSPSPAFPLCAADKGLWRRMFDHDPRFVMASDKLASKDWVRKVVPEIGIPRVLWRGTDPADLPQSLLSGTCVVKTNHAWRTNIFVRDGIPDDAEIRDRAHAHLAFDHATRQYQWGYFAVPRTLYVEEMISEDPQLADLKIHTVGSRILYFLCLKDRFGDTKRCYWEPDGERGWKPSDLSPRNGGPRDTSPLPTTAAKALQFASQLGQHFDYMRVDLLTDGKEVWFGELTVYPGTGHWPEIEHLPDHPLNLSWDIRKSWFLTTPQRGWRAIYAKALCNALSRQPTLVPSKQTAGM